MLIITRFSYSRLYENKQNFFDNYNEILAKSQFSNT